MSSALIQVRNVPGELHRRLKARAALEGMSMSEFVLREIEKALAVPPRHEVLARIRARGAAAVESGEAGAPAGGGDRGA